MVRHCAGLSDEVEPSPGLDMAGKTDSTQQAHDSYIRRALSAAEGDPAGEAERSGVWRWLF